MKHSIFFLAFLLLIPTTLAALCDVGIDGYCDPNCIEVDYDCDDNPDIANQDALCDAIPDGICDPRCTDSDWDCLTNYTTEVNPLFAPTSEPEQETQDSILPDFIDEADESVSYLSLVILAGILVLVFVVLIMIRSRQHKHMKRYADLYSSVQQSIIQGYSQSQVRDALTQKGYEESFINSLLKPPEKAAIKLKKKLSLAEGSGEHGTINTENSRFRKTNESRTR